MVFVTHDQTIGLSFADRVGIIDASTLVQLDEPEDNLRETIDHFL